MIMAAASMYGDLLIAIVLLIPFETSMFIAALPNP
jgi:hypothetical protein